MRVRGAVVVVTGASSGIGRATALAFPRRGASVVVAERVATAIVNLVRVPRRAVVVGPAGKVLVQQARFAPRATERVIARYVDRAHLDHGDRVPPAAGNLYEPAPGTGAVGGGWGGRRRTAVRRTVALATAAGAVTARRRR